MSADPFIETRDAWVEFPIFDAKTRSLKKTFLGKAGGAIGRNTENVVVIEALRDEVARLRSLAAIYEQPLNRDKTFTFTGRELAAMLKEEAADA